ILKSMV
ncbi:ABC transporter ATP-binding protein uup, partial [Haemophilus influenzae]